MITPDALIGATGLRLRHRIHRDPDGIIRILRRDGGAVFLTPAQHHALLADHDAAVRPISRRLRRRFNLATPMTLLSLWAATWTGIDAVDRLPQPFALLGGVAIVAWWPFLALYLHWRSMRDVEDALDAVLADLPAAPAPPPRPVLFHRLEIIALFLVGPALLIDVGGSLFPCLFDNTPLTGRSIGLQTAAAFTVFALLTGRKLVITMRDRAARAPKARASVAIDPSRMARLAGRARSEDAV